MMKDLQMLQETNHGEFPTKFMLVIFTNFELVFLEKITTRHRNSQLKKRKKKNAVRLHNFMQATIFNLRKAKQLETQRLPDN